MDEIINQNGHTRGPWTIEDESHGHDEAIFELKGDSGSKPIACLYTSFFSDEHDITEEEALADEQEYERNMSLIAAAPELLEALEWIVDFIHASDTPQIKKACAVIAKARGE